MIDNPTLLHALLEVALRPNRENRKRLKAGVECRSARPAPVRTATGWLHDTSDTLPTHAEIGHAYVYVASVKLAGPVKFGRTSNARERIKSLETARGGRFGFIWISKVCSNAEAIERALHAQSAKVRQVGEWFAMPFDEAVKQADEAPYASLDRIAYQGRLAAAAENSLRRKPPH